MIRTLFVYAGLAWQTVSPEAARHARAGLEAKQAGHLQAAIAEFKQVTDLAPDFAAAFVNLGAAYMEDRQYAEAIPVLKRALSIDSSLAGADQMLGYALLSAGYAAEAIPHLEKAHAQEALGIAQLKTGKLPEAVANLNAALAKHPNDPDLLYYLGRASGLFSKEIFDTLESAYPDSARAHQSLADNYTALRQIPEAEREYRAALQLQPDTPGLHLALGELYGAASDWPQAEEQFRTEVKTQPGDAETSYRLGMALLQQGKTKEARSQLELANNLRPAMPETLFALGKAASLENDPGAAENAWSSLLTIEKTGPLAAQAHFGLANLYRKQGKTAEADSQMQQFHQAESRK